MHFKTRLGKLVFFNSQNFIKDYFFIYYNFSYSMAYKQILCCSFKRFMHCLLTI